MAAQRLRLLAMVIVPPVLGGCGGDETDPAAPVEPCLAPSRIIADGRCVEPGVQDDGCPAGTLGLGDGSCQPAGIPPESCAAGFEPNGDLCEPILPPGPCPLGLMAVPGETQCRPVMPCGAGPWGDLPVDGTTSYVDGFYAGGDSDGSAARPWTTIGDAVATASPGALVAVAEGSYVENVIISHKAVRLWGVCPERVALVGTGFQLAALFVTSGADGTEIGGIAITGAGAGLLLSGVEHVAVHQVWIHDTGNRGINLEDYNGPTAATVSGALIEQTIDAGVYVLGSAVTIEASEVRSHGPKPSDLSGGQGIRLRGNVESGAPSKLTLRSSVVTDSLGAAVYAVGSQAVIEASVLRDTLPRAGDPVRGNGVYVGEQSSTGARGTLSLLASVIERNHEAGVLVVGADATIEATLVRDTLPLPSNQTEGRGIHLQGGASMGGRSTLTATNSTVAGNHVLGLMVSGSDATVSATVVRDTLPQASDLSSGAGVGVTVDDLTGEPGVLALHGVVVSDSHHLGLAVSGSAVTATGTVVRRTTPQAADNHFGQGIAALPDLATALLPVLTLKAVVVEQCHDAGLFFQGGQATVETTVVRDVLPRAADQRYGRGMSIQYDDTVDSRTSLTLAWSAVQRSYEVGVFVSDADVVLDHCLIADTVANTNGAAGDGLAVRAFSSPPTVTVNSLRIENSERAAVSNFGAVVSIGSSTMQCQAYDLGGESLDGFTFTFEDRGDNLCGCPTADVACLVQSAGLEPPDQIAPLE